MSVCIGFGAGLGFQSKVVGAALHPPRSGRLAGPGRLSPVEHNVLELPATDCREQPPEHQLLSHPCPDVQDSQVGGGVSCVLFSSCWKSMKA